MAQEQKSIKGCVTLKNVGICYGDKDIFDYAEDVEYGLRELIEISNVK